MSLRYFPRCSILLLAGLLVVLAVACDQTGEPATNAPIIFPPTPTFPVLAAPILLPDGAAKPPATSLSAGKTAAQSDGRATRFPPEAEPTKTAVPPNTPTAIATQMPLPTETPAPTPTPCATPGQVLLGEFNSRVAGTVNYRVYLPPCYSDSGRSYPVLYMLPGNIHTDSIWDELGLDEAAEAGIARKELPPFLAVMVSGGTLANNTSGGPGSYETFFFEEFVPYIDAGYCTWPDADGRAIGGMSRGGYWALEIAFRHADAFASVGGHSAALLDFNGGPTINPLDTGISNDLGDLRIYLDVGEDDWLIDNVRALHEQMLAAEREHTWVLNEGFHEDAYWAAHVAEYLDWYTLPWPTNPEAYPPCHSMAPS